MKILIVAPLQPGIDARPEIAAVATGHTVTILDGHVTAWRLEDALREHQYDVIHFVQHGQAGLLQLSDRKVTLEWLVRVLGCQESLRLVFLNACDSVEIGAAIHNAVGCAVVANVGNITDKAALRMATDMYAALDNGATVEEAFAEAKASLRRLYPEEADIPVLINGHAPMEQMIISELSERMSAVERRLEALEDKVERLIVRPYITLTDVLLIVLIAVQVWQVVIR